MCLRKIASVVCIMRKNNNIKMSVQIVRTMSYFGLGLDLSLVYKTGPECLYKLLKQIT